MDLKTQLFLQVAKMLQQNSEQQDTPLLRAIKALLQNRQDQQEQQFTSRSSKQQQQQQQRNDCNNADMESELLRLVASTAGLLGATAEDRGSSLNHSNLQQGGLSSQGLLSAFGSEELSPHSQPWGDTTAEKGLTDNVQTLTRLLSDDGRSSPPACIAADAAARSGPLGLPQWPATTVLGSTRASESQSGAVTPWAQGVSSTSAVREPFDGGLTEEGLDLQPWRRAVCVILEDVLENCILEVGSQQRQGSVLSQERLQFAPMVGRLKALAAKSCSKDELRPFLRLFARSIRLGLVPSKQSEDVQQLILDALGALDDALATSRAPQPPVPLARSPLNTESTSPFTVLPAGGGTFT